MRLCRCARARVHERVCEHEHAACALGYFAHLCDAALVEGGGADVAGNVIGNKRVRNLAVIFFGPLPERRLALLNVAVGADDLLALHAHHLTGTLGAGAVQEGQDA